MSPKRKRKPQFTPDTQEDKDAYRRLLEGGFTKMGIAKTVGITKQAVTRWQAIPLKYVRTLSEATGISKRKLRPSDFT